MERWFDTGLKMEDGRTTISVRAENEARAEAYIKKGWKPLSTRIMRKKERKVKKMKGENKAVEKVIERVYKDRLKTTGRLPSAKEVREIEKKVKDAAERTDKGKSL